MDGHWAAGAVKRALGCAAGRPQPGRPVVALPVDQVLRRLVGQPLPPDVAVVGERAVGVDAVGVSEAWRWGWTSRWCRGDAEEAVLRVDGVELAVLGFGLIQAMSSPTVVTSQPSKPLGGISIAKLVLPQALGKAPRRSASCRPADFDAEDQHVLGQPALVAGHDRGDAQRKALLAEQRVAAVAAAEGPDLAGLRKVADVLVLDIVGTGPGHILLARGQRRTNTVHAGHELAVLAQHLQHRLAHAGHDALVDDHIGRVGDLDADVGDRRAQRPHAERDDVHGAPAHAAVEALLQQFAHLPGPSSCWSGRRPPRARSR
jgi:hypothetical protein